MLGPHHTAFINYACSNWGTPPQVIQLQALGSQDNLLLPISLMDIKLHVEKCTVTFKIVLKLMQR